MMKRFVFCCVCFLAALRSFSQHTERSLWLSELDLSKMTCVMGIPKINKSIRGDTMQIGGEKFVQGVGTHAYSRMLIDLHGTATRFSAKVGLDDGAYIHASISFYVIGDSKVLWESGLVKKGEKPKAINVDLTGIKKLGLLVTVNREDISENYADWADAKIDYLGEKPVALDNVVNAKQFGLLTPLPPKKPRINGPDVYGVRPGSPVLYRIPVTGVRPMQFRAEHLPQGLQLDQSKGIVTGAVVKAGRYPVVLVARNKFGESKKQLTLVAGEQLALTPPMGWNSWYIYYSQVSDSVMRLSADAMVKSGMADYGYQYVNIDDGWMNKPGSKNEDETGPLRNAEGEIMSNRRFPDMKGLTTYIHSKGLKAGIYSSPGPKTCAGYAGSYQHEAQDAAAFAGWGFDFLKYDWCSYGSVAKSSALEALKKPFVVMGDELKKTGRDLVFNLCQYGMGDVWKWGAEAGHSWRTGPDLGTSTGSFLPGFYNVALSNSEHGQYARPGAWNDPDYINIGWVGGTNGGGRKTTFTPNEHYAYMSLWSLMASPLFFSGDMSRLDSFLLNVLCNHEVIGVNQDVLGKQGKIVRNDSTGMVMIKDLADGSKAVGLFNFPGSKKNSKDYFVWEEGDDGTRKIKLTTSDMGIKGKFRVRNLWTQKDLGAFANSFETEVPYHGVVLLKISQ
ncbi:MAG: alpha-galactosidase [Sphingobacteriales bacterium]|nr:MAG: alpha-galactosidase [Sphingobacteriales bacterium]